MLIDGTEWVRSHAAFYAGSRCGSDVPAPFRIPEEAAWLTGSSPGLYGHDLNQLLIIDASHLAPCDHPERDHRSSVDQYEAWLCEGLTPPPISVIQMADGTLSIVDGHRRWAAALRQNTTVPAWINWCIPCPLHRPFTTRNLIGITLEIATFLGLDHSDATPFPETEACQLAMLGVHAAMTFPDE